MPISAEGALLYDIFLQIRSLSIDQRSHARPWTEWILSNDTECMGHAIQNAGIHGFPEGSHGGCRTIKKYQGPSQGPAPVSAQLLKFCAFMQVH